MSNDLGDDVTDVAYFRFQLEGNETVQKGSMELTFIKGGEWLVVWIVTFSLSINIDLVIYALHACSHEHRIIRCYITPIPKNKNKKLNSITNVFLFFYFFNSVCIEKSHYPV